MYEVWSLTPPDCGSQDAYFGYFYVMESPQTTVRLTSGDKSVRVGLDDLEVRYKAILNYLHNAVLCFVLGLETLSNFPTACFEHLPC